MLILPIVFVSLVEYEQTDGGTDLSHAATPDNLYKDVMEAKEGFGVQSHAE